MASRVGVNLRASAYLHQGDRKYMEDEFQVAYQRSNDKKDIEYAFFGVFDGHGGKEAAHYAKDNLMDNIVSQRLFWSENDENVLCAIKEGFLQTHMAMWKELDQWPRTASGWPSTSGTTASVAFIRRQKIYIGHVGDSGIVLGYEKGNEWLGMSLTRDHKPENILELNRITESGGKVIAKSGVPRVVWNRPKLGHQGPVRRSTPMDEIPFLAVARSLGDLWSYNAINNQFVVSPEPDVCVIDIDINHHRCLVFGTDGLWNALSPNTAVNIAYNSEKNNEKHYLGVPTGCGKQPLWINPSLCIVSGALERFHRVNLRADNTSAVTVYLDPPGKPKREVLLDQLSLKKGSPSKNVPTKPLSEKLYEASVKVHVYNQSWNVGDSNRGLPNKEPVPEDGHNHNDIGPSQSLKGSNSDNSSQENLISSPSKDDDDQENISETESDVANRFTHCRCSECGFERSSSIHTLLRCKMESHCDEKPKNDAIQIPLVSSSTFIEGSEEDKEENLKDSKAKTEVSTTGSSLVGSAKRCTRSRVSLPLQAENRRVSLSSKSHSSTKSLPTPFNGTDTSNRILKSVNRASCIKVLDSSPSLKRKRSRDLQQEERASKSIRVHTRSHTMSYKSMITRSQGKTQPKRKSK